MSSTNNSEKLTVGDCWFILFSIPVSIVCRGYVLSKLWSWLVVSTFTTLPPLTVVTALGISLFAHFMLFDGISQQANSAVARALAYIFIPWVFLAVGYIITLFM